MRITRPILVAVIVAAGIPHGGRTAEADEVKTIVDRAIRALGGAGTLNKFKAATWKGHGTFYGLGDGIAYTGTWAVQPPEQARIETHGEFKGTKFSRILVINGDQGWMQTDGTTQALDKERLAEEKERLHAAWVATVAPLAGKDFQLSLLPRIKVDGKQAVGIKVARTGHRDVNLYFDPQTGLLLKSDLRTKNPRTGRETAEEVFYSAYQDFNGVKRATRIRVMVDHKRFATGRITDFTPRAKLEDQVFAQP